MMHYSNEPTSLAFVDTYFLAFVNTHFLAPLFHFACIPLVYSFCTCISASAIIPCWRMHFHPLLMPSIYRVTIRVTVSRQDIEGWQNAYDREARLSKGKGLRGYPKKSNTFSIPSEGVNI